MLLRISSLRLKCRIILMLGMLIFLALISLYEGWRREEVLSIGAKEFYHEEFQSRHILQTKGNESLGNNTAGDKCKEDKTGGNLFPKEIFNSAQLGSGAIALHIIGVLYMFLAIDMVCEDYFVPSLDVVIERFSISPDVAGATLMAAGGSAPELFTSIVGVFIAMSDVGIGTIVGSAVFNVLFVIAACAWASEKALSLSAWPLIRDCSFYLVALGLLVFFFFDDVIHWYEALALFSWYTAYVTFMKFNLEMEKRFLTAFPSLAPTQEGKEEEEEENDEKEKRNSNQSSSMRSRMRQMKKIEKKKRQTDEEANEKELEKKEEEKYVPKVKAGAQGSIGEKMWYFLGLPMNILHYITIPDPQDPKKKKYFALTFIISIVWIGGYSYLMVWWATEIGKFFGIPDSVMGLTFLAAGTSVPDLVTSVLVARKGYGDMAVSSSIGSNLFDVTVGLPVPWLIYAAVFQKSINVSSVGMACNIAMLFLMLALVIASIMAFKWKMTKMMGVVMMFLYFGFLVFAVLQSECVFICPI